MGRKSKKSDDAVEEIKIDVNEADTDDCPPSSSSKAKLKNFKESIRNLKSRLNPRRKKNDVKEISIKPEAENNECWGEPANSRPASHGSRGSRGNSAHAPSSVKSPTDSASSRSTSATSSNSCESSDKTELTMENFDDDDIPVIYDAKFNAGMDYDVDSD